jgi:hypothetical protein
VQCADVKLLKASVAGLVLPPATAHATGGEDADGFLNGATADGIPYADRTAMLYVGNDITGSAAQ